MVPLKDVKVEATLENALATVNFDMIYYNPSEDTIQTTYEFPIDSMTVMSKLTVYLEDKVIEALVMEKEEAEKVYDEVIAGGDLGVYVERRIG